VAMECARYSDSVNHLNRVLTLTLTLTLNTNTNTNTIGCKWSLGALCLTLSLFLILSLSLSLSLFLSLSRSLGAVCWCCTCYITTRQSVKQNGKKRGSGYSLSFALSLSLLLLIRTLEQKLMLVLSSLQSMLHPPAPAELVVESRLALASHYVLVNKRGDVAVEQARMSVDVAQSLFGKESERVCECMVIINIYNCMKFSVYLCLFVFICVYVCLSLSRLF